MEIFIKPKDRVYTIINGIVYSAEVLFLVEGTNTIQAQINDKYRTTNFLTYGESFFMTYDKASKVVSMRVQKQLELKESREKLQSPKTDHIDVKVEKNSIKPNVCESCGYILNGTYLCKCSL